MASLLILGVILSTLFGLEGNLFVIGTDEVIVDSGDPAAQAPIGNVTAGSLLATMTSLRMQGVLEGTAIGGGVATAVGDALL